MYVYNYPKGNLFVKTKQRHFIGKIATRLVQAEGVSPEKGESWNEIFLAWGAEFIAPTAETVSKGIKEFWHGSAVWNGKEWRLTGYQNSYFDLDHPKTRKLTRDWNPPKMSSLK